MTTAPYETTSVQGQLTISERIRPDEAELFRSLLLDSLPTHYDEVDASFPDSIVDTATAGTDRHGYFTRTKRLFVGRVDGRTQAFTVASYKRGGAVKMGPTVVLPELRRTGLGTAFRRLVEDRILDDQHIRKLYLTVTSGNTRTLLFNLGLGYQVEGVLAGQYRKGSSELVLGKVVRGGRLSDLPYGRRLAPAPAGGVEVSETPPGAQELEAYLTPRMREGFAGIDGTFVHSILDALSEDRQTYACKGKRLLVARQPDGALCGAAVLVPKRGGAAKISPLVADHQGALLELVEHAVHAARQMGRHRLYAIVPELERDTVERLTAHGFHLEAQLREAYKAGVDSFVLGRTL
ncbi:hypothetical protein GCM10010260_43830 [Streptomyces filipinensis]|uniref:N-acetyltransferase domain-containing protein n=1 Tax=Streptomyces filipinensis TaxID=66887 RepID=A0A918IDS5_9ACTN|nr:hypothetical protein [Streptomyces filipinensis]GGV02284.1 hypothetical protein GCM10010260_43830 [Streptomyces filipinensis]